MDKKPKPSQLTPAVEAAVSKPMPGQRLSVHEKTQLLKLAGNPHILEEERHEIVKAINNLDAEGYEIKRQWLLATIEERFNEQGGGLSSLPLKNPQLVGVLERVHQKIPVTIEKEYPPNPVHLLQYQGPSVHFEVNQRYFGLSYFSQSGLYCLHGPWPNPRRIISIESPSAPTLAERLLKWAVEPFQV